MAAYYAHMLFPFVRFVFRFQTKFESFLSIKKPHIAGDDYTKFRIYPSRDEANLEWQLRSSSLL